MNLSKGEGYGLTPREAIIRGIPTIVSNNSGHLDIPNSYCYKIPTISKTPAIYDLWSNPVGNYWSCDLSVAADTMRRVRDDYETALTIVDKARTDRYSVTLSYHTIARDMMKHLEPTVVLVCPSVGKTCGIAEYNRHIQDSFIKNDIGCVTVPTINRAFQIAKSTNSVTSVIVHHEYGLWKNRSALS